MTPILHVAWRRHGRRILPVLTVAAIGMAAVACGDDDDGGAAAKWVRRGRLR